MESEEMVSYAHVNDPYRRFCQYTKDPLPVWAVDVQEYSEEDLEHDEEELLIK